jgi:hypothetical protein
MKIRGLYGGELALLHTVSSGFSLISFGNLPIFRAKIVTLWPRWIAFLTVTIPVGPVAPSIKIFFFDIVADIVREAEFRQEDKGKLSTENNEH